MNISFSIFIFLIDLWSWKRPGGFILLFMANLFCRCLLLRFQMVLHHFSQPLSAKGIRIDFLPGLLFCVLRHKTCISLVSNLLLWPGYALMYLDKQNLLNGSQLDDCIRIAPDWCTTSTDQRISLFLIPHVFVSMESVFLRLFILSFI